MSMPARNSWYTQKKTMTNDLAEKHNSNINITSAKNSQYTTTNAILIQIANRVRSEDGSILDVLQIITQECRHQLNEMISQYQRAY
jgi:hypothetical protein